MGLIRNFLIRIGLIKRKPLNINIQKSYGFTDREKGWKFKDIRIGMGKS